MMLSARTPHGHTSASASLAIQGMVNIAKMWMSVNERIMQVVCMTVSTSLAITDAPAMMDSTWHMMDTTVWMWMSVLRATAAVSRAVST